MKTMRHIYWLIGCIVLATVPWVATAQTMVYLEHSETLSFDSRRHLEAQLLKGNVRFRHDEAVMYCDSAYFYEKTNSFDAFGHVRFEQGDTLQGFGDVLYYDGNTKLARLRHNVRLIHRNTILTTDSMNYDRVLDLAYYIQDGTIVDSLNSLRSVWGGYSPSTNEALFRHKVHLENESFTLDADTLIYNTKTNVAQIVCPTTIVYAGETTILSSNGWYNTASEQSMLLDRSQIIHDDGKQLTGDTIYYDKKIGIGNVFGHMVMKDTVQKMTLKGNYGIMYEKEKGGFATDSAQAIDWSQPDFTYIHADTLFTEEVPCTPDSFYTDTTYRRMRAYHNVRAYNVDYQIVCDSLTYNGRDSMMTLHHEPVCWSAENQISADTIHIYLHNGKLDYAHGIGSALGIKQEDSICYDQLSGKEMKAFIIDGQVKRVEVSGNAETVFFPRDDDSVYVGVNKSQSSYVTMFLENNKIHHVLFTTITNGTLYPLDQIERKDTYLLGFFWAHQERPRSPQDIFNRPRRTARPTQKALSATEDEEDEEDNDTHKKKNKKRKK